MYQTEANIRIIPITVDHINEKSFLITKHGAKLDAANKCLEFKASGDKSFSVRVGEFVVIIRNHVIVVDTRELLSMIGPFEFENVFEEKQAVYAYRTKKTDDVYTREDFQSHVNSGLFIDSDGVGYPVLENRFDHDWVIKPSTFPENMPEDATHVLWYNK